MRIPEIRLEDLADSSRFPIHANGSHISMMEKCVFCMGNCSHTTGVTLNIKNVTTCEDFQFLLHWDIAYDERMQAAHADENESAEKSAIAIAFLLMTQLFPYMVVRQAKRGKHFDYILADKNATLPFQSDTAAVLECSGIMQGGQSKINARIKEKETRFRKKAQDHPVFIAVVEHSEPVAQIKKVLP